MVTVELIWVGIALEAGEGSSENFVGVEDCDKFGDLFCGVVCWYLSINFDESIPELPMVQLVSFSFLSSSVRKNDSASTTVASKSQASPKTVSVDTDVTKTQLSSTDVIKGMIAEGKVSHNLLIGEFLMIKPINTGDLISAIAQGFLLNWIMFSILRLDFYKIRQEEMKS
ncbi:hypothetical protein FQA39_LY00888 [Lamprigera yunnana]|nr:hypothetical protein FQA39_LY00888 [Lamprigera yunnana]